MWIDAENGSVYTPRMEGGMPRVNIYDISRHAGVSIATVSRVLNNSPHVSEETRRKVMKVIDGCGYVPNAFARGLGEFGATAMIAGNIAGRTRTLPLAVYSAVAAGDWDAAGWYVAVIVGICLLVVIGLNVYLYKTKQQQGE